MPSPVSGILCRRASFPLSVPSTVEGASGSDGAKAFPWSSRRSFRSFWKSAIRCAIALSWALVRRAVSPSPPELAVSDVVPAAPSETGSRPLRLRLLLQRSRLPISRKFKGSQFSGLPAWSGAYGLAYAAARLGLAKRDENCAAANQALAGPASPRRSSSHSDCADVQRRR